MLARRLSIPLALALLVLGCTGAAVFSDAAAPIATPAPAPSASAGAGDVMDAGPR